MSEADGKLRQLGLKVDVVEGKPCLIIANQSAWVRKVLGDTPYGDIQGVLRNLPGAAPSPALRYHTGFVSRGTSVPLSLFDPA
jgi:hypothetical protein